MALLPAMKRLTEHPGRAGAGLLLALGLLAGAWLWAAPPAPPVAAKPATPPADAPRVIVELVSDFESNKLVSDLEDFRPVTETRFGRDGSQTVTLGEEAALWVRNAHVDGKFFFERYYQGKYIGRRSQLDLALPELGPGEHRIEPGAHIFTITAAGVAASKDPDIRVQGLSLIHI